MPRRGQTATHTVTYRYPGETPNKMAIFGGVDVALSEAASMAQNGARTYVDARDTPADPSDCHLAGFGGRVTHKPAYDPQSGRFTCSCGSNTYDQDQMTIHMGHAGLCSFCAGNRVVVRAASKLTTQCPVCGGSGEDSSVDYHGVELDAYISPVRNPA